MRRFTMYRRNAPETHTEFQKNAPDEPQFEGVVFTDGSVAVRWRTAICSTSVWKCLDDLMKIHGHPEYDSELVWHDAKSGALPDREVYWLVERNTLPPQYVSLNSAGWHPDVWQAKRFNTETAAHDYWRAMGEDRTQFKPVEHMFINKA